ncbi:hypothetical protein I79_005210 [Cricetulus griseus]|uniref:Uncharacterized protein n=1 Tax=Cricetulus griseus TaxID=10029 RepID=G3H4K7_CRIGR|nr:hypothetical protein I79_005210 [Cricetulus griseus]
MEAGYYVHNKYINIYQKREKTPQRSKGPGVVSHCTLTVLCERTPLIPEFRK